jgi:hypothetical protein
VSVSTTIDLRVEAARSVSLDQGTSKQLHQLIRKLQWPSGTGTSEANEVWSDSRSVNAAADDDLELDSLSQLTAAGATERSVAFTVVKVVAIRNTSAADYITVGGAGAASWAGAGYMLTDDSDLIAVPAGGLLLWVDPVGKAVTNSHTDTLRISGVTSTQTYEIVLVGETA